MKADNKLKEIAQAIRLLRCYNCEMSQIIKARMINELSGQLHMNIIDNLKKANSEVPQR